MLTHIGVWVKTKINKLAFVINAVRDYRGKEGLKDCSKSYKLARRRTNSNVKEAKLMVRARQRNDNDQSNKPLGNVNNNRNNTHNCYNKRLPKIIFIVTIITTSNK